MTTPNLVAPLTFVAVWVTAITPIRFSFSLVRAL